MSIQSVACPQCRAALRSQRFVAPEEMVRCPQCGHHFVAGMSSILLPTVHASLAKMLIPATLAALVGGVATVGGAFYLVGPRPTTVAAVDSEHDQQLAEQKRRLEQQAQEVAQEPDGLLEEKRQKDFHQFMADGKKLLADKKYDQAITAFNGALSVYPDDPDAKQGLDTARAMKREAVASKPTDAAKPKEEPTPAKDDSAKDFARLLDQANDALRDKKYDTAIDNATAAQRLVPDDPRLQQLIDTAKKAKDDARLEFNRLMTATQIALGTKQFQQAQQLNALALLLFPTDVAALKLQQDLQQLIADQQNAQATQQAAYAIVMTVAVQEMQAHHFQHAARAFTEALRLVPGDPAATQGLADAQRNIAAGDAVRNADVDRLLTFAADAMSRKLYRDAMAIYKEALKIAPDNLTVQAGLQKATYNHGMVDGEKAMLRKRFGDAVVLFKEALDAVPGDHTAKEQLRAARFQHAIQDGTAAMKEKRFADAVPMFEEALKEKPMDLTLKELLRQAKFGRAMADGIRAMNSRKYDDAISSFQDALREKPSDPTANKLLAQARLMKN